MPRYIFDDANGDQRPGSDSPALTYAGTWAQPGGSCSGCAPDHNSIPIHPPMAEMETWHDATVESGSIAASVSVTFTGTSISAYCLLPPNQGSPFISTTFLSFTLDGEDVGPGFQWTGGAGPWIYNHSVFSSSALTNGKHTFTLSAVPNGTQSSYLVFDYFAYEFGDDSGGGGVLPPSSSSSPAASSSPSSAARTATTTTTKPMTTNSSGNSTVMSSSSSSSTTNSGSSSTVSASSILTASHSTPHTSSTFPAAASIGPSNFASPTGGSLATGRVVSSTGSIAHTGTPNSTIVGAVVGSVLFVSLLALCVIWVLRRRKTKVVRAPSPFDLYSTQQTLGQPVSQTGYAQSAGSSSSDDSSVMQSTRNLPTDTRPGNENSPNRLITITEYLARWRATAEQKRALQGDGGGAGTSRLKRDTEFLTAARDAM
ncbi:hypothetical protein PHLGIDRAFT_455255 [Phlebiopsis gigantea 11061_1 CR5-6]|uniref:Uncharacterized protein n=1 Tax=Phlebiopsis gigantea (strain 11061_1 CR5-6) TaxID=745531 RepID=A0A0C3SD63_PHLG1|nr:hypothetical protein PHLGIDRAFT_455255 [Phlebiopsis gigantea 11061_1 CR5-6]